MIKRCEICGELFRTKSRNSRFCNNIHYDNCPICGKRKEIKRGNLGKPPVVCSYECRSKLTEKISLEKYGCKAPGNNPEARKKASETMMKNLGVPYAMMSKEVQEKSKEVLLEKYGVDNIGKHPEYKMKAVQTAIDRYGKLPFNMPESYEKQHKTIMKRYNVRSALEIPHVQQSSRKKISKMNQDLKARIEKYGYTCQLEYELEGKYYDLRIENTDYLIELNPTYTHTGYADESNEYFNMYYHRDRSLVAEAAGLRCVHIWDWDSQTKVLGAMFKISTYDLSEFQIYKLNSEVANKFLKENDIRGEVKGNALHLGAVKNNEVFACISFIKSRYSNTFDIELVRYTQKLFVQIPGVFDALSSQASITFGISKCICYMDYSKPYNMSILEEMNMKYERMIQPAKIYSKGTKFYTENVLEKHFNTVETIDKEHGWNPIYTCGTKVYIFE